MENVARYLVSGDAGALKINNDQSKYISGLAGSNIDNEQGFLVAGFPCESGLGETLNRINR